MLLLGSKRHHLVCFGTSVNGLGFWAFKSLGPLRYPEEAVYSNLKQTGIPAYIPADYFNPRHRTPFFKHGQKLAFRVSKSSRVSMKNLVLRWFGSGIQSRTVSLYRQGWYPCGLRANHSK